jgi:hypothetical protein
MGVPAGATLFGRGFQMVQSRLIATLFPSPAAPTGVTSMRGSLVA